MLHRSLVLAVALALSVAANAGDKKDAPKWDVNAAHGPVKQIRFTTDEGTWMDLDVSRDGQTIVFSLLGDLYTLPIAGGNAKRISSGPAWDVQPRFSPDGSEIAFTSDRAGGNNLWRAKRDGRSARRTSACSTIRRGRPMASTWSVASISRRSVRSVPANCGCSTRAAVPGCN